MQKLRFQLFLTLFLITSISYSQNLIPNPSFETKIFCPQYTNQIKAASSWSNCGNTPDYFNVCAPPGLSPPNTNFAYQYPNTGVAMAGLILYDNPSGPAGPNYREFTGAQLTNTLQIGIKYYLSFYINFSWFTSSTAIACNNMGLRFSTVASDSTYPPLLNNYAHLRSASIITDTVNWIKVSGSFIADSTYKYIYLGNFFDDSNTTISVVGTFTAGGGVDAYYFFDDICVSTDSVYNETWTGISVLRKQQDDISIYPNPVSDIVSIKANESIEEIYFINNLGQNVYIEKINAVSVSTFRLSVAEFPNGVYSLRIRTKNKIMASLLTIIH